MTVQGQGVSSNAGVSLMAVSASVLSTDVTMGTRVNDHHLSQLLSALGRSSSAPGLILGADRTGAEGQKQMWSGPPSTGNLG